MSDAESEEITLFAASGELSPLEGRMKGEPYYLALQCLENGEPLECDEIELCAFLDVLSHEVLLYEPRGQLAGPIVLAVNQERIDCNDRMLTIPGFVEHDAVQFESCTARGILFVENPRVLAILSEAGFCDRFGCLLATGAGIPRAGARRLLHRIERELQLKVHLLADNDTWGYFIYSVLKRGLLAPNASSRFFAIPDVNYLGLRAGEAQAMDVEAEISRPWRPLWDARLAAMRTYDCFQTDDWVTEFDRFEHQASAIDVSAFISALGVQRFMDEYLDSRL